MLRALILMYLTSCAFAEIELGTQANHVVVTTSDADYISYLRWLCVPKANQVGAIWNSGNADQVRTLATSPVQQEIVDAMFANDAEVFLFANLSDAIDTVAMRLEMVRKFHEINQQSIWNLGPHFPPPSYQVGGAINDWKRGDDPKKQYLFKQTRATPSEAIDLLLDPTNEVYGDCYGGCIACLWWSASKANPALFNANHSQAFLNMSDESTFRPIHVHDAVGAEPIPGDWLNMVNYNYGFVSKYAYFFRNDKDPQGPWLDHGRVFNAQSENMIYLGGGAYEGIGYSQPHTEQQFRDLLMKSYNNTFAKIIANNGFMTDANGVKTPVTSIVLADAPDKIKFVTHFRLTIQDYPSDGH